MKQRAAQGDLLTKWNPGEANPKQKRFYQSRALYTAYGGAKGGGKTHAVRIKAIGGALTYPGIKILIMRCHYPELEGNHIEPIKRMVCPNLASYNGTTHLMTFPNGSTIKFGHWSGEESETEYNGLEFDWIFIDEATQFSERAFNFLGGCLRGANKIPKRMYLTCNPGGVGHNWVKRLFIKREFISDPEDPERNENPEDYVFIPATVDDNTQLLESTPTYKQQLAKLPEDLRQAYRYGDWDAIDGGSYFNEFSVARHVCTPFRLAEHWPLYRSFDYGLDMFACYWWAVDEDGRCWCFREFCEKGLIAPDAAKKALEHTLGNEIIAVTYAPPDVWNRQKDTGKTMAESFMQNGVPIVKADNNRVQGHMAMKQMLAPIPLKDEYVISMYPEGTAPAMLPGLIFFDNCKEIIQDIQEIQHDDNNPNDCAKQPHEITHTVDGVRYFCVSRTMKAENAKQEAEDADEAALDTTEDYESYMVGGELTESYMRY